MTTSPKSILQPEKERTVTPGPEAVADLESLPVQPRAGALIFKDVTTKDAGKTEREQYGRVEFPFNPLMRGYSPSRLGIYDSIKRLEDENQVLPSAPLLCEILYRMLFITIQQKPTLGVEPHERIAPVLDQFDGWNGGVSKLPVMPGNGIHCNTLVDWEAGRIRHYPLISDPQLSDPPFESYVNRGLTYSLSFFQFPDGESNLELLLGKTAEMFFLEQLLGNGSGYALLSLGKHFDKPVTVKGPLYTPKNPSLVQIFFAANKIHIDCTVQPRAKSAKGITRGVRTYA